MILKYILALTETAHALLHCKVLFSIGQLYTVQELEKKRNYFIWDMSTVILSATYLLISRNITMTTMVLTGLHNLLHMYYIMNWSMKENFFIVSIREWSAEKDLNERMVKNGKPMFLYNTLGTIFDIYVHVYMAWQLI